MVSSIVSRITAIVLVLTSVSIMAAEEKSGGGGDLASASTNPVADLVSFRLQNQYSPDNYNADGYSNLILAQVVMPVKLESEAVPLFVSRTTIPYVATPDLDGVGRREGLGDTSMLGFAIPKLETKGVALGLGYSLTIPTAGDNVFTGAGKWSAGPAIVYLNLKTKGLQWGVLAFTNFSFASQSQDSSNPHVSNFNIQPILTKHFEGGYYASLPDNPQTYNNRTENWVTQIGGRFGKVTKWGAQPIDMFGQVTYNTEDNDDEVAAEWSFKFQLGFLFPG